MRRVTEELRKLVSVDEITLVKAKVHPLDSRGERVHDAEPSTRPFASETFRMTSRSLVLRGCHRF